MTASKMTVNGVSVCATGQENYERFEARRGKWFYQYDYRHTDGELFSIVLPTLEKCREERDKWLSAKSLPNTEHRKTPKSNVITTVFQCYKREFVKGEKAGVWEKTAPMIEYGENATYSMLIDGSGYYIDDPDNELQYFVDMKQLSEINK